MGKYSVKGSAAFDARIDADMKRIADSVWSADCAAHWKALVLLGGYGRGEGSPLIGENGEELPFNDYDLIVVTDSVDPAIRKTLKQLEQQLSKKIGLPVDLYPYLEQSLPSCEFSLLNYEMKYGHRVIRGDQHILDAMPNYPHGRIPLSEGTRLLMNRGKLLLDIKRRISLSDPLTEEERRRFLKFLYKADLAFGDCALLINNVYDISYTVKKERIGTIANIPPEVSTPYREAVAFKEWTDFNRLANTNVIERFEQTVRRWQQVFLGYETRRMDCLFQSPEDYAQTFPQLGQEGSLIKNVLHNVRTFGPAALRAPLAHPRLRLYAALPLLLAAEPNKLLLKLLLNSRQDHFESLCKTFYALQQKFS